MAKSSSIANFPGCVQVFPDHLRFQLAPTTQPGCLLTLTNDSFTEIAFKVKTTEPKRYLVRPNQGLIDVGTSEKVNVYLVERECNELVKSIGPVGVNGDGGGTGKKIGDKFLLQTVALDKKTFSAIRRLSAKEQPEELTRLWSRVAKEGVRNKKMAVVLVPPPSQATSSPVTPSRSGSGPGAPRATPPVTRAAAATAAAVATAAATEPAPGAAEGRGDQIEQGSMSKDAPRGERIEKRPVGSNSNGKSGVGGHGRGASIDKGEWRGLEAGAGPGAGVSATGKATNGNGRRNTLKSSRWVGDASRGVEGGVSPGAGGVSAPGQRGWRDGGGDGRREEERDGAVVEPNQKEMMEEARALRKKYDDLVDYTANLTEERNELNLSLEDAKRALQREMATRIALESKRVQAGMQARGGSRSGAGSLRSTTFRGSGVDSGVGGMASEHRRGFTWLHLVVVGIISLLLGRWLATSTMES